MLFFSSGVIFLTCLVVGSWLGLSSQQTMPSALYNFPDVPPVNGSANAKYVALTFDDGPHKVLTPRLLDALKNTKAKVTFFVMGIKVGTHPQILRRAISEGHEVANHAWNHPVLAKLPWEDVKQQLRSTSLRIANLTDVLPNVMRPPYGNTNRKLNDRIYKELGLPVIMWSLDTLDWQRPGVEKIIQRVNQKVKSGTIILCHDIHPDTIEAVVRIVNDLEGKGYVFKTISEMIQMYYPTSTGSRV